MQPTQAKAPNHPVAHDAKTTSVEGRNENSPPPLANFDLKKSMDLDLSERESLLRPTDVAVRRAREPRNTAARVIVAMCLALLAGVIVTLMGRFDYRCIATIRLPRGTSIELTNRFRSDLLAFAGEQLLRNADDKKKPPAWAVEASEAGIVRLVMTTHDTKLGVERVRSVAQGFVTRTQLAAMEARTSPTEAEKLASDYVTDLQSRMSDAESKVAAALAQLPKSDPQQDRNDLLKHWHDLRTRFVDVKEELGTTAELSARFDSQPEPTHAIVPVDERNTALKNDDVLQQDLRELEVSLTEAKLHLLNVWQKSSAKLDALEPAVRRLEEAVPPKSKPTSAKNDANTISDETKKYSEALTAFREGWVRDFAALKDQAIDPMSVSLLETHIRLRNMLHDFLFATDKNLSAMRTLTDPTMTGAEVDAKKLVAQSTISRAFHELETAHHQFEFAAGDIDARDNFRLDSAINKSRGLRRRTQEHIRGIDEKLQAEATKRAREKFSRDREEAKKRLTIVRQSADTTVEELVALQEKLNINSGLSEQFLKSMLQVEMAQKQLKATESDLSKRAEQLKSMTAKREAMPDGRDLEIASAGVVGSPINVGERVRSGALAAVLTFAAVMFVQWRLVRRE